MLNVSTTRIVGSFHFGPNSFEQLNNVTSEKRENSENRVIYLVDHFFEGSDLVKKIDIQKNDILKFIDSSNEPTTEAVDALKKMVIDSGSKDSVVAVVGIGGGICLDSAKALSNLLTNDGPSENYQGWNLVQNPGVFKIGVPTLSGTGAEASRTCVLTNKAKNLKLGMNSPHTVFDHLILDPELTKTVDRNQYFYTAMDTYIHCIESLRGSFRHPFADGYSFEALRLMREVMLSEDMMSDENRSKVMTASYFGGSAVGNSFVGVVHPLSAGLGTVYGSKHCISNCIVMQQMQDYYPEEYEEFMKMKERQGVEIPTGIASNATEEEMRKIYEASVVHEKPLTNALGPNFKDVLTYEKASELFRRM